MHVEQHAGVDGEVVDALLGLLLEHVEVELDVELLDPPFTRSRHS